LYSRQQYGVIAVTRRGNSGSSGGFVAVKKSASKEVFQLLFQFIDL